MTSTHAETVKEVLETLNPAQQMFYAQAIEDAGKNPFKALKSLSDDMAAGELESTYYKPAALARSAIQGIIDGDTGKPDLANPEKADQDIMERAAQMEKEGRHEDAMRLYEGIRVANEKEAEKVASLENAEAVRDAQAAVFKAEKRTAYFEDLERERDALIERHLTLGRDNKGQRITRADAEFRYEQENRAKLENALLRTHQLTPAQVADSE